MAYSEWDMDNTIYKANAGVEIKNEINYDSIKDPNTQVDMINDSNYTQDTFFDFKLEFD